MAISFELQDPPRELVDQITPISELGARLKFAPRLGFLAVNGEHGGIHIVAFHSDKEENRDSITPVANLRERPPQKRRLDDNAKGLGVIIGNSMESISYPSRVERSQRRHGTWMTPELLPEDIVDVRLKDMPAALISVTGIGRHAYLKVLEQLHKNLNRLQGIASEEAKLRGVEMAIKSIEHRYGKATLAIIDPAPTWLKDQSHHGIQHAVPPAWGVYRDHTQPLVRIGSATMRARDQEPQSDNIHEIVARPYDGMIAAAQSAS